jgi:coproporphyrinogen III oxidase-like Fe-S oxidoreductase
MSTSAWTTFALPEDDLARSRAGKLQRNFQGYSTHADAPMVALGVSAISAVGNSYSQNEKTLTAITNVSMRCCRSRAASR